MRFKPFFAFTLCALLAAGTSSRAEVNWETTSSFTAGSTPLDLASSLNGKNVFVLSRGLVTIYGNEGQIQGTIPVDPSYTRIAVSGLDLANLDDKIFLSNDSGKVEEISYSFIVSIDTTNAPFLGPADAPISIVVFSDFQCPYCARIGPDLEQIITNNPATVKVVYKHFPLRGHNEATPAAIAAIAAHRQGKFWQYHDALFQNMQQLNPDKFQEIAVTLQLDMEQFRKDLIDPQAMAVIAKDQQDGAQAGVKGTPSLFINGRKIKDRGIAALQKMIDAELNRLKTGK
ncbi:MAG: DsbA family protein [Thermodesulfobacteriota bacterium]